MCVVVYAKECVTTDLLNQLTPKMDGAKAHNPHPAIWVSAMTQWVGGCGERRKTRGTSLGEAVVGSDVGGSSKY